MEATSGIIRTKLFRHGNRSGYVSCPELIQRLEAASSLPLMVIQAPAGYGKTSLVIEWLDSTQGDAAGVGSLRELHVHLDDLISHMSSDFPGFNAIEARVLSSLLFIQEGRSDAAVAALSEAIRMAAAENLLLPFIPHLSQLAEPLGRLQELGEYPEFVQILLHLSNSRVHLSVGTPAPREPSGPPAMTEEPSPRELEVLGRMSEGLTNQEIADALFVSLFTVKAHLRSIFSKLNARSRTQAVKNARDAGML